VEEYVLGGVPVGGAIVYLVEMAKRLGLDSKFAMPLSIALGVLLYTTYSAVIGATPEQWWISTVMGVLSGGFASGAYSGIKAIRE
jgi:hypothetical protein